MTATAGVGVIATSSLPLLRDFGIIVAMNVAVALLSALVVLPPMLVWADERQLGVPGPGARARCSTGPPATPTRPRRPAAERPHEPEPA